MTQLLELNYNLCVAYENNLNSRIIFLDISKAFDRVWHQALLYKLKKNGISGNLLRWIENYLNNRKQRVLINNQNSSWGEIGAGVPQGSVLGPLFFLVFINDLSDSVIHNKVNFFAEDTCIYNSFSYSDRVSATEMLNLVWKIF